MPRLRSQYARRCSKDAVGPPQTIFISLPVQTAGNSRAEARWWCHVAVPNCRPGLYSPTGVLKKLHYIRPRRSFRVPATLPWKFFRQRRDGGAGRCPMSGRDVSRPPVFKCRWCATPPQRSLLDGPHAVLIVKSVGRVEIHGAVQLSVPGIVIARGVKKGCRRISPRRINFDAGPHCRVKDRASGAWWCW